jgi:hypothetical protein
MKFDIEKWHKYVDWSTSMFEAEQQYQKTGVGKLGTKI